MAGTPVPGKDSFTSALIDALEYLVKYSAEGRFTTVELLRRIKHHSPDFPAEQFPVLSDREHVGPAGRIMLHPLQPESPNTQISQKDRVDLELTKRQTVTLHFDFDEKPQLEHIRTLGEEFNGVFERNLMRVNGVRWGGLKQSMAARAVQTFLEGRQRRASFRREQSTLTIDSNEDWPTQELQAPLTPSSNGQHSPRIEDLIPNKTLIINTSQLGLSPPLDWKNDPDYQSQGRLKRRRTAGTKREIH